MKRTQTRAGILIVATVFSFATGCKKQPSKAPEPVTVVQPAPGATGGVSTGSPMITPPSTGQITDEQVRSYVLSHRIPPAVQAANLAVVSTNFITSQQVSSLLRTPKIGVPDDEPMCLVVLSGSFVFRGPHGSTSAFPVAVEVFDARTGHLMQAGGLSHPPAGTAVPGSRAD